MRLLSGKFCEPQSTRRARSFVRGFFAVHKSKLPGCIFLLKIPSGEQFVGAQKE
jgi:hypothetical protein